MKRSYALVAVVAASLVLSGGVSHAAGNLVFNFNSDAAGWTFGTIPSSGTATPTSAFWQWVPPPTVSGGGLQGLLGSGSSVSGAFALSPCLQLFQPSQGQNYTSFDFSAYTAFPEGVLGQMQFAVVTGSTVGPWRGIRGIDWTVDNNHISPTQSDLTGFVPPLVESASGTSNIWLAFSGTSAGAPTHIQSAFTMQWADYALVEGDMIQFRFMVGVSGSVPSPSPATVVWEVNDFKMDGVILCAVPEPSTLALAGVAVACSLGGLARRRRRPPAAVAGSGDRPRRCGAYRAWR